MSDAKQGPPDGAAAPEPEAPEIKPVLTPNQAKRVNSTVVGMLMAVGVTLAVVIAVVLLNPTHTAETYQRNIDVGTVAEQAADDAGYLPAAPSLPGGWTSNFARWTTGAGDGVDYWEVGYLTAGGGFIQLTQTNEGNPSWLSQRVGPAQVSGERIISGVKWQLLERSEGDTFLTSEVDGTTLVLNGEADLAEFDTLGAAVLKKVSGASSTAPAP